tara:strand:+ start:547 stop:972 length:426 start_codon:yes stop_codon:yes gene_type:complete
MIKYNLLCKDCAADFDSWFSSSAEFERIKKMNLLYCHYCNSQKIEKSLMAPNLLNTKKNKKNNKNEKYSKVKNKLKEYQRFIKNNFDYVGDNFTYEARSIHYNKKNNKKRIYGSASSKDIKELSDEGIETQMIPWINDSEN